MTFGITAGQAFMGGSALLGGMISAGGARDAARIQADAANNAAALQKQQFDEQQRLLDPYNQAGLVAQNKLMERLGIGGDPNAAGYGSYSKPFSMADYQADPGYGFRLGEGLKAYAHQAGARGGLISGQTMKGMEEYRQGLASQEYGNAFNRYQTNRANMLQPLGSLMASGQASAAGQAAQAGQYGVNAGNMMMQAGQATAAGQMGAANSINNALSSGASAYQNQSNFNNWLAKQQPTPSSSGDFYGNT